MPGARHLAGPTARLLPLLLLLFVLVACTDSPPALELRTIRDEISADGRGAPAVLGYSLGRPASIDFYALAPNGERFYLRRDEPRPSGQAYQYQFDGTYPVVERPGERRVLPDGDYRLVLEAVTASGQRQQTESRIAVRNADTSPPALTEVSAVPSTISPNFDGQDDAATISYQLAERATVSTFATDSRGQRVYVGPRAPREPGEYREQWDGLDSKQVPLPDGSYTLAVQSADAAGNVVITQVPINLVAGGRPEARLMNVTFSPPQLASGDTLQVRFTVRNSGTTVLRTQGPEPGFTYSSYDTYASVLDRRYVDRAGVWRVGVDWAGSPSGSVSKYPYRWGFGQDLAPGQETTVEGLIRVEHGPLQDRGSGPPNNRLFFYAGLIQENMSFFDDKVGGTWIEIGY